MANLALLLFADAVGRRRGESRGVALRAALPAAFIQPPGLGLLVALALANRNAPPPLARPAPPPPPQAQIGVQGQQLIGALLPPPPARP